MLGSLIRKVVGTKNDRELKAMTPLVDAVNAFEPQISALSDSELRAKTDQFRQRLASGETLDDLLPEAFAVCREAARRVLGMRPFDVQIVGGVVLHRGKIAEMKTGEGKTLVATLPVYLNALEGKGVHVVTVNDYLAKRDSHWMGEVYRFLGLTVGLIQHDLDDEARVEAYRSDVTYGTNNEFGFDYLRDNIRDPRSAIARVQPELHYAIVDEVDSILIDEARTPLIISGPTEESTDKYYQIDKIIPLLKPEVHYTSEEKTKTVSLTEEGNARVEKLLGLSNMYDLANLEIVHHVTQALRAHVMFRRDVDYVVKDGEVLIVDEFTGRLMPGRRWSDGLHQAVEAKEGVKIANENQTLATITFQNYFRLYDKLAGMTGTADTEAAEFNKIYNLDVVVIPTHMDMIREDYADVIYKTEKEKFNAIIEEIVELNTKEQPVLVGTISVEKSETLSTLLKKRGVKHSVLNAKYHEKEAEIVAQAGRKGAVTIATNMAGRGTDIVLGGNPSFMLNQWLIKYPDALEADRVASLQKFREACEAEKKDVIGAGGLHILGTERHESRRIDNQLRGRSGRQGDPGSSRFFLSLEDDLLRIFGSDRIKGIMNRLGMEDGVPIEHRMVTKAIANAQKKVEAHNFDIRKQLIEYDDVLNKQREVIYGQRREWAVAESLRKTVLDDMVDEVIESQITTFCPEGVYPEEWDVKGLKDTCARIFGTADLAPDETLREMGREGLAEFVRQKAFEVYEAKEKEYGAEIMRHLEKAILLRQIDVQWKDHLLTMDSLKEGIGLRGYGQKDPLVEYKREGFDMFAEMVERVKIDSISNLFRVQLVREQPAAAPPPRQVLHLNRGEEQAAKPIHREISKVGRNDPCTCGSGKKYKKCCGR